MNNLSVFVWAVVLLFGCKSWFSEETPEATSFGELIQKVNCDGKDPRFIITSCDNASCSVIKCEDRLPNPEDMAEYCRKSTITVHKMVSDTCREHEEVVCTEPVATQIWQCRRVCTLYRQCE